MSPPSPTPLRRVRALQRHLRISPVTLGIALASLVVVVVVVIVLTRLPQHLAATRGFRWELAGAAALVVPLIYLGNTTSLVASAGWRPTFGRTLQLEVGEAITLLLTPANAGSATLRVRFLGRTGLSRAQAATATGIYSLLTTIVSSVAVALATAIAASNVDLDRVRDLVPSSRWQLIVVLAALVVVAGAAVRGPRLRRRLRRWLADAAHYLRSVSRRPRDGAAIAFGELLTMTGQVACLALLVAATSNPVEPAVLLVATQLSFTATIAVPVPGGLGIPDAILVAALVSTGSNADGAVVAAVGYRMLTYWLPTLPGTALLYDLYRRRLV